MARSISDKLNPLYWVIKLRPLYKNEVNFKGIEMIVKYSDNFFIQWDVIYSLDNNLDLGIFNFWINDICYPARGINITLNSLFHVLTNNIESIDNLKNDLGDIEIDKIDFSVLDNKKLIWLDTGELFQYGFGMVLGFNKGKERVFYTIDYETNFSEIVLPKGTLRATLEALFLNESF